MFKINNKLIAAWCSYRNSMQQTFTKQNTKVLLLVRSGEIEEFILFSGWFTQSNYNYLTNIPYLYSEIINEKCKLKKFKWMPFKGARMFHIKSLKNNVQTRSNFEL